MRALRNTPRRWMVVLVAVVLVTLLATSAFAGGPAGWRGDPRADLFVDVPLDYDTRVIFPFGGSHHAVPGVVTINRAPYYCRPHKLSFEARAAFVGEHRRVGLEVTFAECGEAQAIGGERGDFDHHGIKSRGPRAPAWTRSGFAPR